MTRDEVIKGMETHVRIVRGVQQSCNGCPLNGKGSVADDRYAAWYAACIDQLHEAVLAMLKAEPKRGRWQPNPYDRNWSFCSVCGRGTELVVYEDGGRKFYNYGFCPWCGAKMEDNDEHTKPDRDT